MLSHEQTLEWINKHRAWRLAKKTKPIWARPVRPEEVGKEFQTADLAVEKAQEGYWLCVGVAGEPWFQKLDRINTRYDRGEDTVKRFTFDTEPRSYTIYQPKGDVRNWVAKIEGPGIEGFAVQSSFGTLHSPAGGYAVMDHVPDPYQGAPKDIWLVQPKLFAATYELEP